MITKIYLVKIVFIFICVFVSFGCLNTENSNQTDDDDSSSLTYNSNLSLVKFYTTYFSSIDFDFDKQNTNYSITTTVKKIILYVQTEEEGTLILYSVNDNEEAELKNAEYSKEIELAKGLNEIKIKVKASDNSIKIYNFSLNYVNYFLSSINIENFQLETVFNKYNTVYTGDLSDDYLRITAFKEEDAQKIEYSLDNEEYKPLTNGIASETVNPGVASHILNIKVTSIDENYYNIYEFSFFVNQKINRLQLKGEGLFNSVVKGLFFKKPYLYIADNSGFCIQDISFIDNPTEKSRLTLKGYPDYGIAVKDDVCVIGRTIADASVYDKNKYALDVIDVSQAADPVIIKTVEFDSPLKIVTNDKNEFFIIQNNLFYSFDTKNPSDTELISIASDNSTYEKNSYTLGDYQYFADKVHKTLYIYDLKDSINAEPAAFYSIPLPKISDVTKVFAADHYCFISFLECGVYIFSDR